MSIIALKNESFINFSFICVGFENSAMKASFSLSSLHYHVSETPENKGIKPRQFNSLTKKRKDVNLYRRSWGSSASDQNDEFWSALQPNYDFIMNNELIKNCQVSLSHFNYYYYHFKFKTLHFICLFMCNKIIHLFL